jgi:hypothetical protein
VLERVRQGLLHDAVGGQLEPDRELARLAVDVQLDGQARVAHLRDERREVVQPRLRHERVGVVAAQHPDEAAHLGERAAADLLDGGQHLVGRAALGVERAPLGAGLDDHHRHVVCDRVVQLSRDACAFLDDRLARGDVALALGQLRATLAIADDAADEQHDDERDDGERDALLQRRRARRRSGSHPRRS